MLAAIGHGGPVTSSPKRVSARPKWPAKLQLSPTSLSLLLLSLPFLLLLSFISFPPSNFLRSFRWLFLPASFPFFHDFCSGRPTVTMSGRESPAIAAPSRQRPLCLNGQTNTDYRS